MALDDSSGIRSSTIGFNVHLNRLGNGTCGIHPVYKSHCIEGICCQCHTQIHTSKTYESTYEMFAIKCIIYIAMSI